MYLVQLKYRYQLQFRVQVPDMVYSTGTRSSIQYRYQVQCPVQELSTVSSTGTRYSVKYRNQVQCPVQVPGTMSNTGTRYSVQYRNHVQCPVQVPGTVSSVPALEALGPLSSIEPPAPALEAQPVSLAILPVPLVETTAARRTVNWLTLRGLAFRLFVCLLVCHLVVCLFVCICWRAFFLLLPYPPKIYM